MPQRIEVTRRPSGGVSVPAPGDPRPLLSLVYAAKFGHLGIVLPFLAPWLQGRGLTPAGIGLLLALPPLFKILAPWCWGPWADRSGRRRELMALGAVVAAAALAAMTVSDRWLAFGLLMAIYSFARAPVLPYLEATSLEQSERRELAYGPIRLWGSVAFVVFSGGYGALASRVDDDAGLWVAAALLAACAALALRLPAPERADPAARPAAPPTPGGGIGRFFVACALMQVSHGAYYTFYSIHLQELGHGARTIGALWAIAVVCEVLLLTRMDRIVHRFSAATVLRAALLLAVVRWALIGSVAALPWLALGQTLHAATYAAFHVAAIGVVFRHYGPGRRAAGQAMYSGMTFGAGMFLGNLAAGALAAPLGLRALYLASAGVPLVALGVLGRLPTGPTERMRSATAGSAGS